ncbi:CoA transferase, partial [Streptomyces caniscabiei]|nr:CoA transferase [Streptomyces caniscabiei]
TSVRTGPAQPGADTADVAHDWGIAGLLPDTRAEDVPAEGAAPKDSD